MGSDDDHQIMRPQKILRLSFRLTTITLLSLLLPFSFILLARLSCARFILSLHYFPSAAPPTFFSVFLSTNPALLYALVSTISVSTLVHTLTGRLTFLSQSNYWSPITTRLRGPRLYASWIFLCTLQVCVGLGIQGSVGLGADFSGFGTDRTFFSRLIFFLGLHETMLHWCRLVVKPVVEDTVSSVVLGDNYERWVQRGLLAGSYGSFWYWRLRDEVESLVVVAEAKGELLMDVEMADFAGWWLYYLTVTIGMVRVVKGLMWVGMSLFCRRVGGISDDCPCLLLDDHYNNEDKV